ncbi:MAG: helix-turn-helix transcriptional regulator [Cyanobacteria bacterium SBLK]|nr:helix-turn-helix transcriptional regulator [Cyanobacteria bacterium SBLK]
MEHLAIRPTENPDPSTSSERSSCWENIRLKQSLNPVGEGGFQFEEDHAISMTLASRPVPYLQQQDGKTHTGLYAKGDFTITPAKIPLFVRWEEDENYLQIRLPVRFIQKIARETLQGNCDRLELRPEFQTRNPQIEAIIMMLLAEFQQESTSSLYIDSLANVLAVNLLKQYAAIAPKVPVYEGGLPPYQLRQILDYIDAHLDSEIKLEDLARLPDMSQFHFSRLFKQSLGITPHQYLIQQRIERAKELLKQTERSIADIALECGFNSHSHLGKRFRQLTGVTPKAYRTH